MFLSFLTAFGGKVITFLPNKQIILEKYFIKNCKRTNRAFFSGVKKTPYIYMCEGRRKAGGRQEEARKRGGSEKNIFKKSAKIFGA